MPARGSQAAAKMPERMLDVQELRWLTGLSRATLIKEVKEGGLKEGAAMLAGKLMVPVSTYNGWVEAGRIKQKEAA
ncbi:MAG TPA: hypothetical protein VHY22_10290 [Chthoniobacteraceae bacterium]|jgi:hypothetical protein|nr:hypothetical protein [Chthoniobacteraceae bacterium]